MANDENKMADDEVDEEIEEAEPLKDENDNDITDWEAIAKKNVGIAKRYQTKLKKLKSDKEAKPAEAEAKPQDKKDFDYAEKAYLKAMGVEKDEFSFVLKEMQNTGKTLDEILDSKYFQAELKEKREEKASQEAIPSGTKHSGGAARDSVEYWIAKDELPSADQVELRRKVVNAKLKAETAKSQFTDHPLV